MAFEVQIARERDVATIEERVRQALDDARRSSGAIAARGFGDGYAGDVTRATERLRADRLATPEGSFARLRLAVPDPVARQLAALETHATERRLLDAAARALARELPRAQGVLAVRYEGPEARPVVLAFVSPRLSDGATAPTLLRADIAALEARWRRALDHAYGLQAPVRSTPALAPDLERSLREEVRDSSRSLQDAVRARLRGEAGPDLVRAAGDRSRDAQQAWARAHAARPAPPSRDEFDVVRLRVEGGRTALQRMRSADLDHALDRAVHTAAGAVARPTSDLRIVHWWEGQDLRITVMANRNASAERVDPAALREALAARLREQLMENARHYDTRGTGPAAELGRVTPLEDTRARRDPSPPATRDVQLRFERGAEYLDRIPAEQRQEAVRNAVDRTLSVLGPGGARDLRVKRDGPALEILVAVALDAPVHHAMLERPLFQYRFAREIQRAAAPYPRLPEVARPPEGGELRRSVMGVVGRVLGDRIRGGELGAAVSREGFDALSRAMPRPLQVAHQIGRFITGLARQEE